jgi:hypothetical protein
MRSMTLEGLTTYKGSRPAAQSLQSPCCDPELLEQEVPMVEYWEDKSSVETLSDSLSILSWNRIWGG